MSRGVEVDSDCQKVVDNADYNRIHPRSTGNEHVIEMKALHQNRWPGGAEGNQVELEHVKHDLEHKNDADGIAYDGKGCQMDGAMSTAHHNLKQVETDALATYQADQHEQHQCMTSDVPEPSKPPPINHRTPHTHPNPPRH